MMKNVSTMITQKKTQLWRPSDCASTSATNSFWVFGGISSNLLTHRKNGWIDCNLERKNNYYSPMMMISSRYCGVILNHLVNSYIPTVTFLELHNFLNEYKLIKLSQWKIVLKLKQYFYNLECNSSQEKSI